MLDDWGDTLGLKGSGSHSVRFEQAFIPEHFALENTWMVDTDVSAARRAPAARQPDVRRPHAQLLPGSSRPRSWSAPPRARSTSTRRSSAPARRSGRRSSPRNEDPDYQRWFGLAIGRVGAAEAIAAPGRRAVHEAVPPQRRGRGPLLTRGRSAPEHDRARGADARVGRDAGRHLPHGGLERGAGRPADGADLPRHVDGLGPLRARSSATGRRASWRASISAWSRMS